MQTRSGRPGTGALGLILLVAAIAACGGKPAPKKPHELSTSERVRLAQSMLEAGRVGEALQTLEEAIAKEPDNAQLHLFRGKLTFRAGRLEESAGALRRALEIDPYLTDARNFLGAVYTEQGRLTEGEEQFRAALGDAAYPSPELVHLNLGLLHLKQERLDDAIADFRRAVEIDPRFHRGHFELASALDRSGKVEEAIREYEVAAPGYRDVGEFHYRLGLAYYRAGRKDKARESLDRVIAVSPGSPSAAQADELLRMLD